MLASGARPGGSSGGADQPGSCPPLVIPGSLTYRGPVVPLSLTPVPDLERKDWDAVIGLAPSSLVTRRPSSTAAPYKGTTLHPSTSCRLPPLSSGTPPRTAPVRS